MTTFLNPTIQQGPILVNVLLSLTQLFAKGGEGLAQTLCPLAEASGNLAKQHANQELQKVSDTLQACSQVVEKERTIMGYEFNRLFIGPKPPAAPPYESVYLSSQRLVMQEQTLAVRKMYLAENLQAVNQWNMPDDFIAAELEFAGYLLTRAVEEWNGENVVRGQYYSEFYTKFWAEHLGLWLGAFTETIRQASKLPVFLAVAQLLLYLPSEIK